MKRLPLVLAILVWATVAHAGGQPPNPQTDLPLGPFVEADKGDVVVVPVGSFCAFKLRAGELPTSVLISRDDILGVRFTPKEKNACLMIGKAAGSATLTIVYPDNTRDVYTVMVEFQRKPVAELLRPGFVAITLALPCENAVGGHLGLNDYVVVYATKTSGTQKKTSVLMKNIRVLSTPVGTEARCSLILEATSEEAKSLRNATENGTIALGLVAEADVKNEKVLQDRKGDGDQKHKEATPRTTNTR